MRIKKAVLVGVEYGGRSLTVNNSMEELEQLAQTAGLTPVAKLVQKREKPDAGFFIGRGKAEDIKLVCSEKNAGYVIFDDELTPTQQKNLEEKISAKVMDRTGLILDIFAARAHTQEAKLQVDLAGMYYSLSRLRDRKMGFEQQMGAIGVRSGFGEKKLEIDKRRARDRIAFLKKEILKVKRHRETQRSKRQDVPLPVISIAGYTNAGKSTFLNYITKTAAAYADNKLFATLDTTARRVKLPGGKWALFVDTVGFIHKLPHNLIAAFKSTLEEINFSDIVIHLIDASDENHARKEKTVIEVLKEIGADKLPVINVFNKCDIAGNKNAGRQGYFNISAITGEGVNELLETIEQKLEFGMEYKKILVPYGHMAVIGKIKAVGKILKYKMLTKSAELEILIDKKNWEQIQKQLPAAAIELMDGNETGYARGVKHGKGG